MPRVSVVLLSYNQKEFLRDAVESVLGQSYTDHELIIVENGSTDGSQTLLSEYDGRTGVRLWLHERNEPITQRLNQGIAEARGEYVSLLFSDDYYLPNKLAQQVPVLDGLDGSYGVVYSPGWQWNVILDKRWLTGEVTESGWLLEPLLRHCPAGFIVPIAPLYRRQCFLDFPFHEDVFQEGEAILFRIALRWKFHFQSEPTVVMRDHGRNIGKAVKRNAEIFETLMQRLVLEPQFPASAVPLVHATRVRCLRLAGWNTLRLNGDAEWARRMLLGSVGVSWRQAVDPKTLAGLGLSLMPHGVRRQVNRALNVVLRPRGNLSYVEEYR